VLIFIVK